MIFFNDYYYFMYIFLHLIFFFLLAGPGAFLVRPSDNSPGDYTLFLLTNNIIQRFRVEKRGVKYIMGGYHSKAAYALGRASAPLTFSRSFVYFAVFAFSFVNIHCKTQPLRAVYAP